MKRTIATLAAVLGATAALAAPASAATNNGSSNWYWAKYCTASGGRLDVTNYDIKTGTWQEYHYDADRASSSNPAPSVYINGTRSSYWNDAYASQPGIWTKNTIKVVFSNGSSCSIYG